MHGWNVGFGGRVAVAGQRPKPSRVFWPRWKNWYNRRRGAIPKLHCCGSAEATVTLRMPAPSLSRLEINDLVAYIRRQAR